ncbi:MAG: anaerobic ribonucleoside-triphosphate reductase [Oscillospiraceae bacterium]
MMTINVNNGTMSKKEQDAYVDYVLRKHPNQKLDSMSIDLDGDFVNLEYKFQQQPFDRIRRITGYLVGTMDRWNDAKVAEEHDRVKHSL